MHRFSENLLAILLTLLLGLSPLQGGMRTIASVSDQEDYLHQMPDTHAVSMVVAADSDMNPDCEQHHTNDGCTDQICSFNHCASCMLAVLPALFYATGYASTLGFLITDSGFISQPSSSLFRPPKV